MPSYQCNSHAGTCCKAPEHGQRSDCFATRSHSNMAARQALNLAVAGAHMTGLPLNYQLTDLSAVFVRSVRTAPMYRMYSLGTRPALVRGAGDGHSLELEVWSIPLENVGAFLRDGVRPPLCIGDVLLEDGSEVKGFLGESYAVADAPDISHFGGWRAFATSKQEEQ